MALFNHQTQNKYYYPQMSGLGYTTNSPATFTFKSLQPVQGGGSSTVENNSFIKPSLFGTTTKQPLFGSSSFTSQSDSKQPLFGSSSFTSQSDSKQPLFGTTQGGFKPLQTFGTTQGDSKPLFGSSSFTTSQVFGTQGDSKPSIELPKPITLSPLDLPKNKIESLIFMVSLDHKNTFFNTKLLIDNALNTTTKLSLHNLWFTALIKYSDENFILQKLEQCSESLVPFIKMYSSLLRELMVESIQTPEQLYTWLIDYAKTHKNKKFLWLFSILKFAKKEQFYDILDLTNEIEIFTVALQTFIEYDNNPTIVVEKAIQSTNSLYKTFLLSMVGASYGKEFYIGGGYFEGLKEVLTS
jgi:hypothetical protein